VAATVAPDFSIPDSVLVTISFVPVAVVVVVLGVVLDVVVLVADADAAVDVDVDVAATVATGRVVINALAVLLLVGHCVADARGCFVGGSGKISLSVSASSKFLSAAAEGSPAADSDWEWVS